MHALHSHIHGFNIPYHCCPAVHSTWLVLSGFTEDAVGPGARPLGSNNGGSAKRARPQHGGAQCANEPTPAQPAATSWASWTTAARAPAAEPSAGANIPASNPTGVQLCGGAVDVDLPRLPSFGSVDLVSHFESGLDISVASDHASLMHVSGGTAEMTSDFNARRPASPWEVRGDTCHVNAPASSVSPTWDDVNACGEARTRAFVRCGVNGVCCARTAARNLVRKVYERYSGMLPRAALEALFGASRAQAASTLEVLLTQGSLDTSADTDLSRDRDGDSMDSSCDPFVLRGSAQGPGLPNVSQEVPGGHAQQETSQPSSEECHGEGMHWEGGAGSDSTAAAVAAKDFHTGIVVVVGTMLENLCLAIEEVMEEMRSPHAAAWEAKAVGGSGYMCAGESMPGGRSDAHAQVCQTLVAVRIAG